MAPKADPAHFALSFNETLAYYLSAMEKAGKDGPAALNAVKRYLASNDLFFLLVFVLKRKEMVHRWLFDRCREVQREPDGHIDLWAREHYKSTIITFGLTIFDIINDPEVTIGIFSHSKSVARAFLTQIKTEFEQNTDLHTLWPEIFYAEPAKQAQKWSVDGGLIVQRKGNPKECTIEAHGLVDGQPTGRHFKKRVYDDVVTLESVGTPEQIAKTTYAWQMSDNLGSEGGTARYIGTRYHLFDTYRTMLDSKIAIPRIHAATINGKEDGQPVLMKPETLQYKRRLQGPYVFSSQMLLNPVADSAMGFNQDWLVFDDVEYNRALRLLWRFIICDPAGGKQRDKNDYTTFWVLGMGEDGKIRVLDMVRDRLSLSGRWEKLLALHKHWKPSLVSYEEYGMQADIEHFKIMMKQEMYEFDIVPLGGSMSKEARILRLVPLFENGFVSRDRGGDGLGKSLIILPTRIAYLDYQNIMHDLVKDFIEQEYTAFPVLKHDDMLDGLARVCDLLAMDLIKKPIEQAAASEGGNSKVEQAYRKMQQAKGSGSWVTA